MTCYIDVPMDRSATNVNIDVDVSTMNHVIKLPARAITDVAVDSGDLAVSYVSFSASLDYSAFFSGTFNVLKKCKMLHC